MEKHLPFLCCCFADGIPTLSALAKLALPPPACAHPGSEGQTKKYAAFRKRFHYKYILEQVEALAKPRVEAIAKLPAWQDKQDAVDVLFETIEVELKQQEDILGLHPKFGEWVERALEEYLRTAQKQSTPSKSKVKTEAKEGADSVTDEDDDDSTSSDSKIEAFAGDAETDVPGNDEGALPVFMDCFSPEEPNQMVPNILSPLKVHPNMGPGRMVEEWELSAHKASKRILLRQCTRSIAQTLEENDTSRIFVHGRKGAGKVRTFGGNAKSS
jgi:hypothetical protein